jgi:hypothetical protein
MRNLWIVLNTPVTKETLKLWWEPLQKVILNLTLLSVLGFICLFFYWLLWPYDPIRIDKFNVDKTTAMQGERICFVFEGEKLLALPANVVVELVDGEAIQIMTYTANNDVGCIMKSRCFNVPYVITPKSYKIRWTAEYPVNHIRKVREVATSDFIKITENPRLKQFMDGK